MDVMFLVFLGFLLGAVSYTAYSYVWQWRKGKAGFSWLSFASMLLSVLIDVVASPLLNVPGTVPLVLRGLGSGYVLLSSFAFGVMVNFFVAKPLAYFSKRATFAVGRGSTMAGGFWRRRTADLSRLQQPVTRKFRRLWLVVIALAVLIPASFALASLQYQATISTKGNIKAVGVQFYVDATGTVGTNQIDWGMLDPGQTVNVTLYMKSTSNVPVVLGISVGNFNPASGSSYLACTWDYNGITVNPGQIIPIVFTLQVASTVTGITAFSFDIGVIAFQ
jgi:hypothetical protein